MGLLVHQTYIRPLPVGSVEKSSSPPLGNLTWGVLEFSQQGHDINTVDIRMCMRIHFTFECLGWRHPSHLLFSPLSRTCNLPFSGQRSTRAATFRRHEHPVYRARAMFEIIKKGTLSKKFAVTLSANPLIPHWEAQVLDRKVTLLAACGSAKSRPLIM